MGSVTIQSWWFDKFKKKKNESRSILLEGVWLFLFLTRKKRAFQCVQKKKKLVRDGGRKNFPLQKVENNKLKTKQTIHELKSPAAMHAKSPKWSFNSKLTLAWSLLRRLTPAKIRIQVNLVTIYPATKQMCVDTNLSLCLLFWRVPCPPLSSQSNFLQAKSILFEN